MRIISYNVNGLRSAMSKGLNTWLAAAKPDIACFQEIKLTPEQIDPAPFHALGYPYLYWFSAQKKGYSGVATFSTIQPNHIEYGCAHPLFDAEGRVLRLDFDTFSILNVYMPSGSSGDERQQIKFQFMEYFYSYIQNLLSSLPNLIIVGDFNICHKPIDIHNPVSNAKSSGFLPEEREWLTKFFALGFTDTFRYFHTEPHQYTWWSFRAGARSKNLGWRIDYQICSQPLVPKLKRALILSEAKHADHCPTFLEIETD